MRISESGLGTALAIPALNPKRLFLSMKAHRNPPIAILPCFLFNCATAQEPTSSSAGHDTTTSSYEPPASTAETTTAEITTADTSAIETSSTSATTDVTTSSNETTASTAETSSSETADASTGSVHFCGNGLVDDGEACDDGNRADFDGCSKTCTDEFLMFVTTAAFSPNFGGIAGADTLCQSAAENADLTGTYVAWISAWDNNASSDLPMGKPLIRRDGATIVANAEDLIQGSSTTLQNPINLDQDGNPATGYAWTGTNALDVWTGWDCDNWTVYTTDSLGSIGNLNSTHKEWTSDPGPDPIEDIYCKSTHHLYCFRTPGG